MKSTGHRHGRRTWFCTWKAYADGAETYFWAGLVDEVSQTRRPGLMPSIEAVDVDDDVLWLTARVSVYDLKLDSVPVL
jgi:hypothetical protein